VQHIEQLLVGAENNDVPVFVSPHDNFPHDHRWQFGGNPGAEDARDRDVRPARPARDAGFHRLRRRLARADKPYLGVGRTVVCSPHKVYGPEQNDLLLQLRKRGINKVVLAGMSANLCVGSHLRELLELGFEVSVVADATAAESRRPPASDLEHGRLLAVRQRPGGG
jgi:nicotinamidase-related amidase